MSLLDRIANYFKEWDGIDETAPKMELNINELRYIANMNVERCRLLKQLNEANLKTEALLLDKAQEIRAKAIDEFAERLKEEYVFDSICRDDISKYEYINKINEIAEQLAGE